MNFTYFINASGFVRDLTRCMTHTKHISTALLFTCLFTTRVGVGLKTNFKHKYGENNSRLH